MKNKSVKRELNPIQQSLFSKLKDIMLVDQRRLSARIHGIGKIKSQEAQQAVAAEIQMQIEQAQLRVENRKSAVQNPIIFQKACPLANAKPKFKNCFLSIRSLWWQGKPVRVKPPNCRKCVWN